MNVVYVKLCHEARHRGKLCNDVEEAGKLETKWETLDAAQWVESQVRIGECDLTSHPPTRIFSCPNSLDLTYATKYVVLRRD